MPEDQKTIYKLKEQFLRQQIRILSQPLRLNDRAREQIDLPKDDLNDILLRANQILRRHNESAFDRVAVSNVATQIEQLFWFSSEPEDLLMGENGEDDGILRRGDDLLEERNIDKLTAMLEEDDTITEELSTQISQLIALHDRRKTLLRKVQRYREVQRLIEPLKNPQQNVQPSLVTREGPLADELARMKTLGIRVAGVIARRNGVGSEGAGDADEDVVMVDERAKVDEILRAR